jgi:hypothetical protein
VKTPSLRHHDRLRAELASGAPDDVKERR